MNIPANVQKYINSLPPNEQKAAMNEIMQSQYKAYKNSPNQVNQQNMQQSIEPPKAEQELRLPSKVTQPKQATQEDGNLEGQLQEMLIAYFEKMKFTEQQAKMFMQEFAKLSDEEKQQMIQELQEELQGSADTTPQQPQSEPQTPPEESMPTEPESMMSGGMFRYKKKMNNKFTTKNQFGGNVNRWY